MKVSKDTDLSKMSPGVRAQVESALKEQPIRGPARMQLDAAQGKPVLPEPVVDMSRPLRSETVFIPYLGKSLNDYLFPAGGAFAYRRDKYTCSYACIAAGVRELASFDRPVRLIYVPKVPAKRRRYDATNFAAVVKQIEDNLVSFGVIRQDDGRWVRGFAVEPAEVAEDGIAGMEVTLQEVGP